MLTILNQITKSNNKLYGICKLKNSTPTFEIELESTGRTLFCGFSEFGLAGLTAVDYMVGQLELQEVGFIATDRLPPITPFQSGTPRHHTRLFSKDEFELIFLVGELFVPPFAAEPFGKEILTYIESQEIEEIVILSGIPIAHGPEEHRAFYIATEDFQDQHFSGVGEIKPMGGGYLDGVNGAVMQASIDSSLQACVLATPVHHQVPDVDAALRLINPVDTLYQIDIDTRPLESFAEDVAKHYEELSTRMEETKLDIPHEDRMYM